MKLRQLISLPSVLIATLAADTLPVVSTGVAVAIVATVTAPSAQALPRDRAAGRQGARASRQTGRHVSQARRRGHYGLPHGAAPFAYGGHRYYRAGGRFYYPYVYGGRTVYIDVDSVGGRPGPPPAAGSIDIDIDID